LSGRDDESKKYYIVRLMIGEKFQMKGFGKAATLKLIGRMGKTKIVVRIAKRNCLRITRIKTNLKNEKETNAIN